MSSLEAKAKNIPYFNNAVLQWPQYWHDEMTWTISDELLTSFVRIVPALLVLVLPSRFRRGLSTFSPAWPGWFISATQAKVNRVLRAHHKSPFSMFVCLSENASLV